MKRVGRIVGPDNEAPPTGPVVLDLHGTPVPHAYQHYTTSFVATSTVSYISFAMRNDAAWLQLDDVSVTTGGGPNLIVNGDFESGVLYESAPIGWNYLNEFDATFSGEVSSGAGHGGLLYYSDGSIQAYDVITQAIPTSIGSIYSISFWLYDNGTLTTFRRRSDNGQPDSYGNGINAIVYAGDIPPVWGRPGLDACIASIFEPGSSATDSGAITVPHYSGFLLLEEPGQGDVLDHLNDATPWIFVAAGSTWYLTITGTWSGAIAIDTSYSSDGDEMNGAPFFSSNGSHSEGPIAFNFYHRFRMCSYSSGAAMLDINITRNQYFLIEEAGASIGRLKLE